MTKIKENKINIFCLAVIVFLALLANRALFKAGLTLHGQDTVSPVTPLFRLQNWAYSWEGNSMLGGNFPTRMVLLFPEAVIFAVLEKLNFSLLLIQKIVYSQIFLVSGLGMYFLSLSFFKKNYSAALAAAVVYMFNHVQLGFWGVFIVESSYILAFYPLLLAIFIRGLKSDKPLPAAILFALSTLFCSAANPPLYIIIFFTIFVFFIYYLLTLPDKKGLLKFTFLAVGFYLFLNFWWLLPSSNFYTAAMTSFKSVSLAKTTLYSSTLKASLLNNLILQGSNYNGYGLWGDKINNYVGYLYETNPFLVVSGFIYPLLAFSVLFFQRNRKKIVYFLAIFSLGSTFLAKGPREPFGIIYQQIYQLVPGFSLFRTPPDKFPMATALGFSLLIGLTASSVFWGLLKYSRLLAKFAFSLLIIILLLAQWPFFTGDIIHSGKSAFPPMATKIPDYYWQAADWLKGQKEVFRIFNFPGANYPTRWLIFKWGFLGTYGILVDIFQKPVIDLPPFADFGKIRWAAYSLLGNSRSLPEDIFGGGIHDSPQTQNAARLLGLMNVKHLLFNRDIESSHLHFGTENQEILLASLEGQKDLGLAANFENLNFYQVGEKSFLPHLYVPEKIVYSSGNTKSLLDIISLDDYQIRSGIFMEPDIYRDSVVSEVSGLKMTEILGRTDEIFLPGELENAVTEDKLGINLAIVSFPYVKNKPEGLMYRLVLLNENFDKWKIRNEPEKLFEKRLFYASKRIAELEKFGTKNTNGLADLLEDYIQEMGEAIKERREIKKMEKFGAYLEAHRRKIDQLDLGEDFKERMRIVFDDFEGKISELKTKRDFSKLVYEIEVPESGDYSLLVRNFSNLNTRELADYLLAAGREEVKIDGGWLELGKRRFGKGKIRLDLPISGISENLIDENLKIKDYTPDSIYRISFDYSAPKGSSFFVAEGKAGEIARTDLVSTGDKFRHFEMFFKSSSEVQEGAMHLSISIAKEKNLKVEKIYQPELLLRRSRGPDLPAGEAGVQKFRAEPPKITFVKINPTKYNVKVEGAKEPYTLVFSESFHRGWKAYIRNVKCQMSNVKCDDGYGEVVASYFDGEVKEGAQRNIFLDRNTFETWGKKPLPEERHLLVNSYANSWYIQPEDAGGKENFELIIEFAPQKLFYIGLFISGLVLIGCLGYLGVEGMAFWFVWRKT